MKEQDFHKIIRENSSNDNRSLADALRKKHPEILQNTNASKDVTAKKSVKKRVAIFAPLATAAVLAVVLIPTLVLYTSDTSNTSENDNTPPPPISYTTAKLDCTVQEYNELFNARFLYFDWFETTDYSVIKYSYRGNEDFLGLGISIKNAETNDYVEYVISSDTDTLDFLKQNISICNNESTVMNSSIKWATQNSNSYGIFDFDGYSYYITLKNNSEETRLFELIEELLLSQE